MNVANLLSGPSEKRGGWFGRILGDLAECGYDAEWDNFPAHNQGLPHKRDRIYVTAYPTKARRARVPLYDYIARRDSADEIRKSVYAGPLVGSCSWAEWEKRTGIRIIGDGVPNGVDRCGAAGNAVIPQIPEMIGNAILQAEAEQ